MAGTVTGALAKAIGGIGRKIGVGMISSSGAAATTTNPSNTGKSLNNGLDNKGATTMTGMQGAISLQIVLEARPITTGARGATIGIMTPQHRQNNNDRIQLALSRGPWLQERGPLQRKRLEAKWLKGPQSVQRLLRHRRPRVQHQRRLSGARQLLTKAIKGTEAKWLRSRAHKSSHSPSEFGHHHRKMKKRASIRPNLVEPDLHVMDVAQRQSGLHVMDAVHRQGESGTTSLGQQKRCSRRSHDTLSASRTRPITKWKLHRFLDHFMKFYLCQQMTML